MYLESAAPARASQDCAFTGSRHGDEVVGLLALLGHAAEGDVQGFPAPLEQLLDRDRRGDRGVAEPLDAVDGPRVVGHRVHEREPGHGPPAVHGQVLGDRAADVVAGDEQLVARAQCVREALDPRGERRHRGRLEREPPAGAARAREVHGDRAHAVPGDHRHDGRPHAAPVGAVEQEHQRAFARGQEADRNAVNGDLGTHRDSLAGGATNVQRPFVASRSRMLITTSGTSRRPAARHRRPPLLVGADVRDGCDARLAVRYFKVTLTVDFALPTVRVSEVLSAFF